MRQIIGIRKDFALVRRVGMEDVDRPAHQLVDRTRKKMFESLERLLGRLVHIVDSEIVVDVAGDHVDRHAAQHLLERRDPVLEPGNSLARVRLKVLLAIGDSFLEFRELVADVDFLDFLGRGVRTCLGFAVFTNFTLELHDFAP